MFKSVLDNHWQVLSLSTSSGNSALFPYHLNTYDHPFLKMLFVPQLILHIFQPLCLLIMLFLDTPNITPKSSTFLRIWHIIWSYPLSFKFCVNLFLISLKSSILSELFNSLLISSDFSTFFPSSCV